MSKYFPSPERATPAGLVAVGGRLAPDWLRDAYTHGIFPWPDPDGRLLWWSPDPRAVLELDQLHVARRLERTLRGGRFQVTFDRDFADVISGCATAGTRRGATWITAQLAAAYLALHQQGQAHSVEVWYQGALAGGVYGVSLGAMFAAESMFFHVRDASKVALVHLVRHLASRGFLLCDVQQATPHLLRFGAREIPRREFLDRLAHCVVQPVRF